MLLILINYLLTENLGQYPNLPISSIEALDEKVSKNILTLCIYGDSNYTQSFYLNFVIEIWKKNLPVLRLLEKDYDEVKIGKSKASVTFPLAVLYHSNQSIFVYQGPKDPLRLSSWIKSYLLTNTRHITNIDQLRTLLLSHGTFIFGCDQKERPSNFPKDLIYYYCPMQFFLSLNITQITSGIHVYRSSDRQLIRVNGNPRPYMKSHLIDIEIDNSSKPYLMGFVIDPKNDVLISKEISVLSEVSPKFEKEFDATIIDGEKGNNLISQYNLSYLSKPFFFVLDRRFKGAGRWVLTNNIHSTKKIKKLLKKIVAQTEQYHIVSSKEQPGEWNFYQLQKYATNVDALILISSSSMPHYYKVLNVFNQLVVALNGTSIQTVHYNLKKNEPPDFFLSNPKNNKPHLYFSSKGNGLKLLNRPYVFTKLLYLIKMNLSSESYNAHWNPQTDLYPSIPF